MKFQCSHSGQFSPNIADLAACYVGRLAMIGPPRQRFQVKIDQKNYIGILHKYLELN